LLDRVSDRLQNDLPMRHVAHVTYKDHRGRELDPEQFVLDFSLLGGALIPDKRMHDLVEEVSKLSANPK
jgi:hypothetical protein